MCGDPTNRVLEKDIKSYILLKYEEIETMTDFPLVPESISHKKLSSLMIGAQKDIHTQLQEISADFSKEEQELEKLFEDWEFLSKELIENLKKKDQLFEKKSSKSLLALGAMEAHIHMALQALKASKNES